MDGALICTILACDVMEDVDDEVDDGVVVDVWTLSTLVLSKPDGRAEGLVTTEL